MIIPKIRRPLIFILCCGFLLFALNLAVAQSREQITIEVDDDASLRAALQNAVPGTTISIAPGEYSPGVYATGLTGEPNAWIVIEGSDSDDPPRFVNGSTGWHLIDCSYTAIRRINVSGQSANGINIDDGGDYSTPSHHIYLGEIHVSDIGPQGNFDGIKLSGVDDFRIRDCELAGWGGQAIDMVGCHRGIIEGCRFVGKEGYVDADTSLQDSAALRARPPVNGSVGINYSQTTGPQAKGGSSDIVIRDCFFDHAAQRGVNLGGSTGREYFRPLNALYEAKNILVEGCVFQGGMSPIAFVGVDGAIVRRNTIVYPEKWLCRILQETRDPEFVSCRNGRFEHNLIVFRRSDVQVFVNIGPDTQPETFEFVENYWYCEDDPDRSRPDLPTPEEDGVYGRDPQLTFSSEGRPEAGNPIAVEYGAESWSPEK